MPMIRGVIPFSGKSNLKDAGTPRDAPFFKKGDEWITPNGEKVEVTTITLDKILRNLEMGKTGKELLEEPSQQDR